MILLDDSFLPSFRIICLCRIPRGDCSAPFPPLCFSALFCALISVSSFSLRFLAWKMYHFIMKHIPGKWTYTITILIRCTQTASIAMWIYIKELNLFTQTFTQQTLLEHLMCAWYFWIPGMQWWTKESNVQPHSSGETNTQPISDILSVGPVLWRW